MLRQTAPSHDRLLVPLDGSPAAETILPAATLLAKRLAAEVALLHVLERNAPDRVHGQRHLTGETDAVHQRMLELEERLDFTERLLAQQREPERLP